jgi:Na+/H+-dicarboxylate symporter
LFVRILVGLLLGIVLGVALGKNAATLKPASDLVLQTLRLLATPLIFLSIVHSVLTANVGSKGVGKLAWLLLSNSVIAIFIGLLVANLVRPGAHVQFPAPEAVTAKPFDPLEELFTKFPKDFLNPFANNDVIGIIVLGLAIALALRAIRSPETESRIATVASYVELGLKVTMQLLHWVFDLVPLAVLAVVARIVGTIGFGPLVSMIWFVGSVLLGLFAMFGVYLLRLRVGSWVRPGQFLLGAIDTFALAFSTASSAAALPVTFECAVKKIGVREESASLGIMVGGTFNHDGTALYEAMAALFVSQAIGQTLSLEHQLLVVFMAVIASVGAAGIPEAGLVTMLAVFNAVHLPLEYVPLLLPLDWILDRVRTTINVAGDLAATCILDGKTPQSVIE